MGSETSAPSRTRASASSRASCAQATLVGRSGRPFEQAERLGAATLRRRRQLQHLDSLVRHAERLDPARAIRREVLLVEPA